MSKRTNLFEEFLSEEYSVKEVQHILTLAMEQRFRNSKTFSVAALKEMAVELGLKDEMLWQAIKTFEKEKIESEQRAIELHKKRKKRKLFYKKELFPYLAVNTFLIALNFSLSGSITWSIYPLLGWGLSLFLKVYSDSSER